MPFTPEDLSIDLLNRTTGYGAAGGIAALPEPTASHNTGSLLKGIMGCIGGKKQSISGSPFFWIAAGGRALGQLHRESA